MSCEFSHVDGSYLLGALPLDERLEFEHHLADCPDCAMAVRRFAGLPALLARVDASVLEAPVVQEPVPPTLLPSLVREVRRTRRRRLGRAAALAAAAAVVVAGGALVGLEVLDEDGQPGAAPPGATSTVPGSEPMLPTGSDGVSGSLAFESVAWGTKLQLTCSYPAASGDAPGRPARTYALVVRTRDGNSEQVATWRGLPGRDMQLMAATAVGRENIASVEVLTASGRPVLWVTG